MAVVSKPLRHSGGRSGSPVDASVVAPRVRPNERKSMSRGPLMHH